MTEEASSLRSMAAPGVTDSPDVMDGEVVRRWFALAVDALDRARAAIDRLNVFPVPDADTGTNMHVTLTQAIAASEPGRDLACGGLRRPGRRLRELRHHRQPAAPRPG